MFGQSINRRGFLGHLLAGGAVGSGWMPALAALAGQQAKANGRHCILLWMAGGPSQIDTFDMKPGHANGGSFKEAATNVPGMRFSEHLPKLAARADNLAIVRGVSTKEGDHGRGTVLMRTGHIPGGPVRYPAIGCSLSKALAPDESELPNYVTIAPGPFAQQSIHPGFLGPRYAATAVAPTGATDANQFADLRVNFLNPTVPADRDARRLALWRSMQSRFQQQKPFANIQAHHTVYESAIRMMHSDAKRAFDLSEEPDKTRSKYGPSAFGQGCLMARRLIEHGVPMVEVTLGNGLGWDTHADNFTQVRRLSEQLDSGWSTLIDDLRDRGLLERTTILWAGEFGRTPVINQNGGRDHFPQAFSCVFAGGGIAGGQVYGATSPDGSEVIEGKVNQQDLLATLCQALGVDPRSENQAGGGRPIAIAEGRVVTEVLSG